MKGLCYQHGENYNSFTSFEEAETVAEAIRNSEVHVAKVCLVVSGCAMNNTSSSDIILAWPTCDKKDFDGAFNHFKSLSITYHDITKKPLMNFSTDGDGTRRQVFNHLLDNTLNEDSPVGGIICGLQFVDLQCGTYHETVSYDLKHLVKRIWTSFTKESVCIQNITIKKTDLKNLFTSLPKSNDLEIDALLYPKDKQNVPSATKFLLYFIDSVRNTKDLPYRLVSIRDHLLLLTYVSDGLLSFYVDMEASIKKQISSFSKASYSLFYLYRESSNIIPNQLYHDLQSTFIDALFCCAKAYVYFPGKPLFLVLNGTDPLERIFGVLRMKNKNNSMDYLMLLHCINSMVRCDELLTMKHTDWSKKGRSSQRLCLDYLSPKDWDADKLKLRGVDIKAWWQAGHMGARAKAVEIGAAKSDQSIDSLSLLGYTLKRPFGKLIGVIEEDESVPFADLITNEKKCQTMRLMGKIFTKPLLLNKFFPRISSLKIA